MILLLGGGGAGKTTIQNELIKRGYKRCILYTTREKRNNEINGKDYIFVSKIEFEELKERGEFIATSKVGENEYGFHRTFFEEKTILATDIKMAKKLKEKSDFNIITIYIEATEEQREERLKKRGDLPSKINEKLQRDKIFHLIEKEFADFNIINDNLEYAVKEIVRIITNLADKEKIEIIDAHSHVGKDFLFGGTSIQEYVQFCKEVGIKKGYVMPQPNPVYNINGNEVPCITWEYENQKIQYKTYDGKNENPYKYLNYYYYQQCNRINDIDICFIPLIHPILDKVDYLQELIRNIKPKALKIHGIGSGLAPHMIPMEFIDLVKQYNIPLILHIECDTRQNGYHSSKKEYIKKVNNAYDWAFFLVNNNLSGLLTHGLALDERAIQLIKGHENIKIGIGPDLAISNQPHRLYLNKNENANKYLELLKRSVSYKQLVFDIDFNWNKDPQSNEIDKLSIDRIKKVWTLPKEQKSIFNLNVRQLYKETELQNNHDKGGENERV